MKQTLSRPIYLAVAGLIAALIIISVVVSVKNANNQASVKKADQIATVYSTDIANYKKSSNSEIKTQAASVNSEQSAAEFAKVIDAKIAGMPPLVSVGEYGSEHSAAYKNVSAAKEQLKNSYEELRSYTREDLTSQYKFLGKVQQMLDMKVSDYLANTQVTDGTPIREKLIPPYQAAYDTFIKLPIPDGQDELAKKVKDTYSSFVTSAQDAAKKLDAKESFSFDFSKEFNDIQNQVNTQKAAVQTTFMTKVEQATK